MGKYVAWLSSRFIKELEKREEEGMGGRERREEGKREERDGERGVYMWIWSVEIGRRFRHHTVAVGRHW